ncbi:SNARE associated Golgi protein [uncultured archaeon]|nr:SNARE associated Golgi protein [uncultured archaeon]
MKAKEYWKLISIPISLFIVYTIVVLIWNLLKLPVGEELVLITTNYFNHYGLVTVLIGALLEGFFIVGQYFPGGLIIFLGVISAGPNILRAAQVVLVVDVAFAIAYSLDYLVGRYGWYKIFMKFGLKHSLENAQDKLKKRGLSTILLSYWEPNLSSIMATAAGVLKLPFRKFFYYSLCGILIWETFWGVLVFNLGNRALDIMNLGLGYMFIILLVWILIIIIVEYFRKRYDRD